MGLWRRVRGAATVADVGSAVVMIVGSGRFEVTVADTDGHVAEVTLIAAGRTTFEADALLRADRGNAYTPYAVEVRVDGHRIGSLPASLAPRFTSAITVELGSTLGDTWSATARLRVEPRRAGAGFAARLDIPSSYFPIGG